MIFEVPAMDDIITRLDKIDKKLESIQRHKLLGKHQSQGIPDTRTNRPELWIFSRVMLYFLYCCFEMVHLDFKYSRTNENQQF